MSVTALDIITSALRELGVEAQGELVSAENSQFMFGKLNQMVDAWSAQNRLLYSKGFSTYTIIPNHQPHTIGIIGLGSELAPALIAPLWTLGVDWAYIAGPDLLDKAGAGVTTATPAGVSPIVAGQTYRVTITVIAIAGGTASYTLGGAAGDSLAAVGTYTKDILAATNAQLIITPDAGATLLTIGGVSIKQLTNNPDFFCSVGRPLEIISGALVLTSSTPNVEIPLEILDDDGWAAVGIKTLTSTLFTKLYYSPDFPNGSIYLWPIATAVNDLRIQTRSLVSRFADLTTAYDLPFGYEDALVMSLAEKSLAAYPRPEMAGLIAKMAQDARAVIGSVNTRSPNISTVIGGRDSSWHFLTGGYK